MTLEQLRVFVTVAETLNMRRAGEILHLTQPAVSAAVAALETRYSTALFDRIGRGLGLSAAGRAFLPEAQAVLARAAESQRVLDDLAGLVRGEVKIAASQTLANYWLPPQMARFATAWPEVELPLTVGNTAQTVEAVLAGEADIGFVEGTVNTASLRIQRVGGDRLSFYVSPRHPLVGQRVKKRELRDAVWVMREPGSGTREHLAAGLAVLGLALEDLTIRLVLPSNSAVLEAVEAGEFIAAVSDLAAASRLAAGKLVRLDGSLPPRAFHLVIHRARRPSRAAKAFVDAIPTYYPEVKVRRKATNASWSAADSLIPGSGC